MSDEEQSVFLDVPEEIEEPPYEEPGPTGAAIALCAMAVFMAIALILMWYVVLVISAFIGYPLASIAILGGAFGGVVYWSLDLTAG